LHEEHNYIYNYDNKRSSLKDRRTRLEEEDLKATLFELFSERDEINFKEIESITN
jgi:nucleoside-specific outer membrane channel protein Tsx